ncbi:MAG: hypothetical protein Q9217_003351 [Psora testacea]
MEEEEKKALFDNLSALDEDSMDEVEALSGIDTILAQSKPLTSTRHQDVSKEVTRGILDPQHSKNSLERTVSAPVHSSISFPVASPKALRLSGPLKIDLSCQPNNNTTYQEAAIDTMNNRGRPAKKRKRGHSLEQLPQSQQIFRGLSFYFFPDNDIARARSLRIRKAMEYGASWIKEWKDGITHIIVDQSLSYTDLLSYLKIDSLPPKIVLVNESYPSGCISFRFLVNPNQPHYQVNGYQEALKSRRSSAAAVSSVTSLQLKPEKKVQQHEETPLRTEDSSPEVASHSRPASSISSRAHHIAETPVPSIEYAADALSEAIDEARNTKDLVRISPHGLRLLTENEPLDIEDDELASKSTYPGDKSDDHCEEERRPQSRSNPSSDKSWQQNFSCMSKHDGKDVADNPNARTIEILQQMAIYYDQTKDHWRTMAYCKVIGQLKKQTQKIVTASQAIQIPCVGERLAAKIEEIVWTNKLRRLDNAKLEPNDEILQIFLKIYGVGFVQASKWVEQGHRTLTDLVRKAPLTRNQRIGIEHFDDFQARIPREEMQEHDKYVYDTVRKIDRSLQFTIGGSYRRGAATSGDVDFIVTKPDASIETIRTLMIDEVIPKLSAIGYLKVGLATTDKSNGSKWHGAATLPGCHLWRRIDFLFVPWDELGAALIYFTGNDIFNRSIRLLASKKGMRLNQRGLWKEVDRGANRRRITQGTLVEGKDEKKIFELLGVPWRPPEHRNC